MTIKHREDSSTKPKPLTTMYYQIPAQKAIPSYMGKKKRKRKLLCYSIIKSDPKISIAIRLLCHFVSPMPNSCEVMVKTMTA